MALLKERRDMLLEDSQRMTELVTLLHKDRSAMYQDKELNEACNNALLLENEERVIIASGRYSINPNLTLCARRYTYEKGSILVRNNISDTYICGRHICDT